VAFDQRRRFDLTRASARPWLLGIATNLIRRRWRDEQRQLTAYTRSLSRDLRAGETELPAQATGKDVAAALAILSPDDRNTLFLVVWADLSYEEVAEALGIPVGTVRSRLARARRILRRQLAPSPKQGPSPQACLNPTFVEESHG